MRPTPCIYEMMWAMDPASSMAVICAWMSLYGSKAYWHKRNQDGAVDMGIVYA